MFNKEMSAIQQRSKKLQQIISETSFDDAKLQQASTHQIYDSEGRKVSFRKIFDRQYGNVSQHDDVITRPSSRTRPSQSSDATASISRTQTATTEEHQHPKSTSKPRRRVLVIFIRHFLCGLCQEYLVRLSTHPSLTLSNLAKHNITVAIIGCGSPSYISSYRALTNIPDSWGLYTDPSTELYDTLGMHRSMSMGDRRPVYIQRTMTGTMLRSIVQGVRRVPKGDIGKAGGWETQGGEFLFEEAKDTEAVGSDEWPLKWCHRMENSRDHTEVEDLVAVMGVNTSPDSPSAATLRDNIPRVHNRSYSTPLTSANVSIPNDKMEPQGSMKRQFSLRRTLSSRRQSWLLTSRSKDPGTCRGGCVANARARELL